MEQRGWRIEKENSGEGGRNFGCCAHWVECSIVQYCCRATTDETRAYLTKHCGLCKNLFVRRSTGWKETWIASAKKVMQRSPTLPRYAQLLQYLEDGIESEEDRCNREVFEAFLEGKEQ